MQPSVYKLQTPEEGMFATWESKQAFHEQVYETCCLVWPYIPMKNSAVLGLGFFNSFLITNAKLGYCNKKKNKTLCRHHVHFTAFA